MRIPMNNSIYILPLILLYTVPSSSRAADLHKAEPGEIVIMRAVTPQPVNRVDQQGPITSNVDLLPNTSMERHLNGPLGSIKAITISDEQAAGIHGSTSIGQRIEGVMTGDANLSQGRHLHGTATGRSISRAGDSTSQLTQVLGAGGGSATTNNAMKGLADALGQAFGPLSR